MGIWGAAELFWGFGEHKQNTFRELGQKLTGIWGDQSIIFRELGSKDPPWGASPVYLPTVGYSLYRHLVYLNLPEGNYPGISGRISHMKLILQ